MRPAATTAAPSRDGSAWGSTCGSLPSTRTSPAPTGSAAPAGCGPTWAASTCNSVFIVAAAATYLWTGWAPLVIIALSHLEIIQQLLPLVRFDGYYILGDLAGVPNLFGHVRPILRSFLPGRHSDPGVGQLQLRTRVVVTTWMLITVPALLIGLGVLTWNAPGYISGFWDRSSQLWSGALALFSAGQFGAAALSLLSLLAITLPLVGLSVVLARSVHQLVRAVQARQTPPSPAEEEPMDAINGGVDEPPSAAVFTEDNMLRRRSPRHSTDGVTGCTARPGAGSTSDPVRRRRKQERIAGAEYDPRPSGEAR